MIINDTHTDLLRTLSRRGPTHRSAPSVGDLQRLYSLTASLQKGEDDVVNKNRHMLAQAIRLDEESTIVMTDGLFMTLTKDGLIRVGYLVLSELVHPAFPAQKDSKFF